MYKSDTVNPSMQNHPSPAIRFLKSIGNDLFDWFSPDKYLNGDSFSARLRSYQTTAFVVFFLCSFSNFLSFFGYSYVITAISCFCLVNLDDRNVAYNAFTRHVLSLHDSAEVMRSSSYDRDTRKGCSRRSVKCRRALRDRTEATPSASARTVGV